MRPDETSNSSIATPILIWEDAADDAWWLARSQDADAVYVLAEDAVTHHVLVLRQAAKGQAYKVVAAIRSGALTDSASAVAAGKDAAVRWVQNPQAADIRADVRRWRTTRCTKIGLRELPLACVAFVIGCALAFIIAAFFIVSNMAGWVMIVVGTFFGAGAGWLLKWLADQKMKSAIGPFGRFLTIAGSATLGALVTMMVFFVLFAA